jgi:L-asparaginase/Glu-tRNA(Gln) amidotransferase subunit D
MYVDASVTAINAFINDKTEGLIIAGLGNGSINQDVLQGIITQYCFNIKLTLA